VLGYAIQIAEALEKAHKKGPSFSPEISIRGPTDRFKVYAE